MNRFVLTLLTLAAAANTLAQEPVVEGARVTVPYEELKRLLDAAYRADSPSQAEPPPVEALLKSARYHLDLSQAPPTLKSAFETRTLTDTWHAIPLCGGDIRLTAIESGENTSVVRHDEGFQFLVNGIGEQQATLDLAVEPLADWDRDKGLRLVPAPSSVSELTIAGIPEDQTIAITGLTPTRSDSGDLLFHLPGDGREIQLLRRDRDDGEEQPIIPSVWTLHSQIVARYEDGRLRHSARIQAQAESGSGLSLTAILPTKASRITVEGDDLDRFEVEPRQDDGRRVRIAWKTRDTLDRTFLMSWELPQSPLAESWILSPTRAGIPEGTPDDGDADESRSLIALVTVDGLELTHPDLKSAVDARQLPAWLREQLGSDESLTAEISGSDPLDLAATWLPRLETAQATISLAEFDSRLVADGSILVMADYTIQHAAPIDWQVALPSADQILTCEVNQTAAKPIQRENDVIEFRLPTPARKQDKEKDDPFQGTRVHLCYSLKLDPLDPVSGRVAVELPQTGLFIHRLEWSLAIPDRYEPTAIEGNVELAAKKEAAAGNLIYLTKELCRDERPSVEIFYQRKDLTTDS